MCEVWAKLAEQYSRALNAHKAAVMSLPGLKELEYEVAWQKAEVLGEARDAALKKLQEHQQEHGC
jgi:hypothetical protein